MGFVIQSDTVVVFDLDDTLYKEIDFLKSAYREISDVLEKETGMSLFDEMMQLFRSNQEVFNQIIEKYGIRTQSEEDLSFLYRNHFPKIHLEHHVAEKLEELKRQDLNIGLITDGRSVTQRNKLKSLGIENYFNEILISEEYGTSKPHPRNYMYMQEQLPGKHYVYIGDNIQKDFLAPNTLGWETICVLDNGSNIHSQHLNLPEDGGQQPNFYIKSFKELNIDHINNFKTIT